MKTYFEIEVIKKGKEEGLSQKVGSYSSAIKKAKKESSKPSVKEVVLYGYEVEIYKNIRTEERFKLDYYHNGRLSISIED